MLESTGGYTQNKWLEWFPGKERHSRSEEKRIGRTKSKSLGESRGKILNNWLWQSEHISPYVGKNWTKLRPKSCVIVMRANNETFGSLIANIIPWRGLYFGSVRTSWTTDNSMQCVRIAFVVLIGFSHIFWESGLCKSGLKCRHPPGVVGLMREEMNI